MQLSGIVNPVHTAFSAASAKYQSAVNYLESPLELPFPILAGNALEDVNTAIGLLTPFAEDANPFTQRSASGSVAAAKEAAAMIGQLANPAGDTAVRLEDVVAKLKTADSILWQE